MISSSVYFRQASKIEPAEEVQVVLDYDKVKQDLQVANERRKCLLLQALRWVRLCEGKERKEICPHFIALPCFYYPPADRWERYGNGLCPSVCQSVHPFMSPLSKA